MPTYEYHCSACDESFEVTCHLDERQKLAVCPKCKSKDVEPVFSSFVCPAPKATF
jgi:putative FmdB family regulatory protein